MFHKISFDLEGSVLFTDNIRYVHEKKTSFFLKQSLLENRAVWLICLMGEEKSIGSECDDIPLGVCCQCMFLSVTN